jgi:hypothetical protein
LCTVACTHQLQRGRPPCLGFDTVAQAELHMLPELLQTSVSAKRSTCVSSS